MSITGSLISYDNKNDSNRSKCKPKVTVTSENNTSFSSKSNKRCSKAHLNCLWSVWYGLCLTGFQAYLVSECVKRFSGYASLPWPNQPPPTLEINAYLVFLGVSIIVLPLFLIAAVLKVGNLANDGFKLGRNLSTCTADPPSVLLGSGENQGVFHNLWQHGGPTAPFLHLTSAFCLLIPKLLMEARLIQSGFLTKDGGLFLGVSLLCALGYMLGVFLKIYPSI